MLSAETDWRGYVRSLECKVCCGTLPHIGNKGRLSGTKNEIVNVDNYADGVASIHLTAIVEKH